MIYFKVFYDIIYNATKINENYTILNIVTKKINNNHFILLYLNTKHQNYQYIFEKIYKKHEKNIDKKTLHNLLKNIHITLWKNPWIKCYGSFDISGYENENTFKYWYKLNDKKINVDNEFYIRLIEPRTCKFIYNEKNKNISSKHDKIYTQIKNHLFFEIKNFIAYIDDTF